MTTEGTLRPGVSRHYIRINPNTDGREDPNAGMLIAGEPAAGAADSTTRPGTSSMPVFWSWCATASAIAHDPIVEDSLRVVDAVLKVDTPQGPCWRRYNHDGYGQRADGTSLRGVGHRPAVAAADRRARALRAGGRSRRGARTCARWRRFAVGIGLICRNRSGIGHAIPDKLLQFGGPTGRRDAAGVGACGVHQAGALGRRRPVFDKIDPVRSRYSRNSNIVREPIEVWSGNGR